MLAALALGLGDHGSDDLRTMQAVAVPMSNPNHVALQSLRNSEMAFIPRRARRHFQIADVAEDMAVCVHAGIPESFAGAGRRHSNQFPYGFPFCLLQI